MVLVALYDVRKNSPSYGELNEIFYWREKSNDHKHSKPLFITGLRPLGDNLHFALIPNNHYNYTEPDEFWLAPNTNEISYKWILEEKKHG